MNPFQVTAGDLDVGICEFKNNEKVKVLIETVVEPNLAEENPMFAFHLRVLDGRFKGKKHILKIFRKNKDGTMNKALINLMQAFFTEDDLIQGKVTGNSFVNKIFTSTIKVNEYKGKEYTNFTDIKEVTGEDQQGY